MRMELSGLRPVGRIVDSVRATLRAAILDGTLPAGFPLSVPELSRRLQVSRSPVREALLQMVADGLAVERPRRGVVVASVAPDDVLQIHEIREVLEALSAKLCATRIDSAGLQELSDILDRQSECVQRSDANGYFHTNAQFHATIARYSGNARLQSILDVLEVQMQMGLREVASRTEQQRLGLQEHRRVLQALRRGAAAQAEKLMRTHISDTKERLKQRVTSAASVGPKRKSFRPASSSA
jgi:DNA-binding GntR family transcriptional regulator